MKAQSSKWFVSLFYALLTGIVYAVGIKYFIRPAGVILTGTEGIAIVITSYSIHYTKLYDTRFLVEEADGGAENRKIFLPELRNNFV